MCVSVADSNYTSYDTTPATQIWDPYPDKRTHCGKKETYILFAQ